MPGGPRLLLLQGSDDATPVGPLGEVRDKGSTDAYKLLGNLVPRDRLRVTPNFFRQGVRPRLGQYDIIFNLITDADQNPRVLDNAVRLLKGFKGRVINRPEAVQRTTRDGVARQLAGLDKLIVPQFLRLPATARHLAAGRVEAAGLRYPLLVRRAGTHTGQFTGLVSGPDELPAALQSAETHLISEFIHFQSDDGMWRKYRVWCVGRHLIFRHLIASDHWNLHISEWDRFMHQRPDLVEEERRLFSRTEGALPDGVHDVLRQIQQRLGLEVMGIDFAIMPDGRVVLFEANATMNFLPFKPNVRFEYLKTAIAPMQRALWELVGFTPPAGTISAPEETAAPAPSP